MKERKINDYIITLYPGIICQPSIFNKLVPPEHPGKGGPFLYLWLTLISKHSTVSQRLGPYSRVLNVRFPFFLATNTCCRRTCLPNP